MQLGRRGFIAVASVFTGVGRGLLAQTAPAQTIAALHATPSVSRMLEMVNFFTRIPSISDALNTVEHLEAGTVHGGYRLTDLEVKTNFSSLLDGLGVTQGLLRGFGRGRMDHSQLQAHFAAEKQKRVEEKLAEQLAQKQNPSLYLARAWEANTGVAINHMKICSEIDAFIGGGKGIELKTLSTLLLDSKFKDRLMREETRRINVKRRQQALSEPTSGPLKIDLKNGGPWVKATLMDAEEAAKLYIDTMLRCVQHPLVSTCESWSDLQQVLRSRVTKGFELPLEDGCLHTLKDHEKDGLARLLSENPQLFPPTSLWRLKTLVKDISKHGQQTIRLNDYYGWHLENLPYRLGLTDAQREVVPTVLDKFKRIEPTVACSLALG